MFFALIDHKSNRVAVCEMDLTNPIVVEEINNLFQFHESSLTDIPIVNGVRKFSDVVDPQTDVVCSDNLYNVLHTVEPYIHDQYVFVEIVGE